MKQPSGRVGTSRLANPLHFFPDDYPHLAPFLERQTKAAADHGRPADVHLHFRALQGMELDRVHFRSRAFRWWGRLVRHQPVCIAVEAEIARHLGGMRADAQLGRFSLGAGLHLLAQPQLCVSILYDECESCPVPAGCRCSSSGQGRRWGRRRSAALTGAATPRAHRSTCSATLWSGSGRRTPAVRGWLPHRDG